MAFAIGYGPIIKKRRKKKVRSKEQWPAFLGLIVVFAASICIPMAAAPLFAELTKPKPTPSVARVLPIEKTGLDSLILALPQTERKVAQSRGWRASRTPDRREVARQETLVELLSADQVDVALLATWAGDEVEYLVRHERELAVIWAERVSRMSHETRREYLQKLGVVDKEQ